MIRVMGVIFCCLVLATPFLVADYFVGNGFLDAFFGGHSVTLMGTLLGLAFVIVVFVIQTITGIESRLGKSLFTSTKKELRHDTYFMLVVFLLHILVLVVCPVRTTDMSRIRGVLIWGCKSINLLLFGLSIYCIVEILRAAFTLIRIDEYGAGKGDSVGEG